MAAACNGDSFPWYASSDCTVNALGALRSDSDRYTDAPVDIYGAIQTQYTYNHNKEIVDIPCKDGHPCQAL